MSNAHHFGGEKVNIYLTDIFKHQLLQSIYRLTRDTADVTTGIRRRWI